MSARPTASPAGEPVRPNDPDPGAAEPAESAPSTSPRDEGGEAACLLSRICPGCDRPAEHIGARFCSRCGTALPVA
ncbi:4-Cys prefix domain-containing protein [Streptomyces sp. NPDC020875]|uniref:4-Cys prefix domain-containing protein n=1 Tax=Streptomyces sp. NPDC020875 TaxID=3154898 RepID=UPI0033DD61D6